MTPDKREKQVLNGMRDNKILLEYLDKVVANVCDVRNGDADYESRKFAADVIQGQIIDQILLKNTQQDESFFGDME